MLPAMKPGLFYGLLGVSLSLAFGCSKREPSTQASPASAAQPPSKAVSTSTNEVAVIKTTAGEMVVEFWPDVAPKTVDNFKKLAREGFYNGTCFHRIMK